jgi:hypothetical protein
MMMMARMRRRSELPIALILMSNATSSILSGGIKVR